MTLNNNGNPPPTSVNEEYHVSLFLQNSQKQSVDQELLNRFINFIDVRPKTIETYTRALKQMFIYFNEQNISHPCRNDILMYRDRLIKRVKPATVQNYIAVVRIFFRWAELEGLYENIASGIKGAFINREHKRDYLTSSQIKCVLEIIDRESMRGIRDYAMISLMVTGGLRGIEVMRANIEDFRSLGDNTVLFIQGKGRDEKAEYVKICSHVDILIRRYLSARKNSKPDSPLFCSLSNNNAGKRLSVRSISGIIKTRLTDAGFNSSRLTAHSLRHTAVTLSLLGGNSLQDVQQFARHSNITTTQIYAHNLDRAKNNCENTIGHAIFSQD